MRCEICGEEAAYLVNGVLGLCEDCFAIIGDEWQEVVDVEELEDCEDDED